MFPENFAWGVASSAYQIEGRDPKDGAGTCIWDTFAREGKVFESQDAMVSCDHIHRYKEDFALMRLLGVKHYRFSLSWSRILPMGTGEVNQKAIDLYRDMILEMKKNGIEPYITIFHWEFPQALQDRGGWVNRESVEWFAQYAKVVAENFSDLCEYFITFNEPQCFIGLGNLTGVHAPGLRLPIRDTFQMVHHMLMAHGKAVLALRKYAKKEIKIGYAPTCSVAYPCRRTAEGCAPEDIEAASSSPGSLSRQAEGYAPEDIEAARRVYFGMREDIHNWTWNVSWFSDPVFLGTYPKEGLEKYKDYLPEITEEDMKLISQPLDFMGQNIYNGYPVRAGADGKPEYVSRVPGHGKTAVQWPVTPECLYWGVKFLYERYQTPIYITENGMSCHDMVSADGKVHDQNRIDFLDAYLSKASKVFEEGVDLRGYFLWTFLDNFEWEKGYNERFGLVYVDFETQKRIPKDSAFWYQQVMETNGACLSGIKNDKENHEILFLNPVFTHNIWGGSRLKDDFRYPVTGEDIGECWGIAAHPNGDCTVKTGAFAGKKLSKLWKEDPELFGNVKKDRFPLLIKIIDAKEDLSIQVHPDDAYANARENGSLGKTECWYIMDCPEGASLVVGHNAQSKEELSDMIHHGRWKELIREIPVKKGDFIQIDPGTVHAIKGGLLILETQQSSDITYRVYDYDRLSGGKPRELHVEKSIDVITAPAKSAADSVIGTENVPKNKLCPLYSCEYYDVFELDLDGKASFEQKYPFLLMSVIEGDGLLNGQLVKKGDHLILPGGFGEVELQGKLKGICSAV